MADGADAGDGEEQHGVGEAEATAPHVRRVAELEAEVAGLRHERWLGETLRDGGRRAGVEIERADPRLADVDDADRERFAAAVEAIVREETARREGAAEAEELRKTLAERDARIAELEKQVANPERHRFDTGGTRSAAADLTGASALDRIRHGLGQR